MTPAPKFVLSFVRSLRLRLAINPFSIHQCESNRVESILSNRIQNHQFHLPLPLPGPMHITSNRIAFPFFSSCHIASLPIPKPIPIDNILSSTLSSLPDNLMTERSLSLGFFPFRLLLLLLWPSSSVSSYPVEYDQRLRLCLRLLSFLSAAVLGPLARCRRQHHARHQ